jgi:hypothetical protein
MSPEQFTAFKEKAAAFETGLLTAGAYLLGCTVEAFEKKLDAFKPHPRTKGSGGKAPEGKGKAKK